MNDSAECGGVDFEFSFAFQPIVDVNSREIISFEALVRGPHGESPANVFARVPRENLHRFDQACRIKAIHVARRLNLKTRLNLNVSLSSNSSQRIGSNIGATLEASSREGFPPQDLVFELGEDERLLHHTRVGKIFRAYQNCGFQTAIDDFGKGYSGLRTLAEYQPNYVKLDRNLVANIHLNCVKQSIVKAIGCVCRRLLIEAIAEGVEKVEEYQWLRKAGIHIFQGFYFARPALEALSGIQPRLF